MISGCDPLILPEQPLAPDLIHVGLRLAHTDYKQLARALAGEIALSDSLETAHPKRQALWLAGRWCAQQALRQAGYDEPPLPGSGAGGEPLWPDGWCGSISHSDTCISALIGPTAHYHGLGIDHEPPMSPQTAQSVMTRLASPTELALRPADWSLPDWLTLIFSAKESLFKAIYPTLGRFFGFQAAEIQAISAEHFQIQLCETLAPAWPAGLRLTGFHALCQGQVLTLVSC